MCSTDAPSGICTDDRGARRPGRPAEEHAVGGEQHRPRARPAARARRSATRRRRPRLTPGAAVQEGLQEHRRRLGVVARRIRRRDVVGIRRAIDVVRRSSSVRIGMRHRLRSRAMNASVSTACGPRSPRSVSGRPTTTTSGASRSMIAHSSAMPLLAADLLDHAERPRERAARVADGDARARAAVVERERLGVVGSRREQARAASSASSRRLASLPPARAIDGRPPPPPPTIGPIALITADASRPSSTASGVMLATSCTRSPSRAPSTTADGPSAPRRRSASSSSESPSVPAGASATSTLSRPRSAAPAVSAARSGPPPLPPPPPPARAAFSSSRTRSLSVATASGSCSGGVRSAAAASLRDAVGAPQRAQRLGPGDRLDPAHALADRRLAHDRERADGGRRAHVRAAAQLHRIARDVDDADDVAVLLAEQHRRAERRAPRPARSRRCAAS